jgi:glutamine synthetase
MNRQRTSVRDVLKTIREEEVEFVDLKFVDLFGGLQHITFPATALDEGSFARGVNFDGSSVRGFQAISESDLILKPDTDSTFRDPFFDDATISMFCDIMDPDGHKPYSRDPRGVAQRAERLIRSLGLADAASFGVEMEFSIIATRVLLHRLRGSAARGREGSDSTASPARQERVLRSSAARSIAQSPWQDLEDDGGHRPGARDAPPRGWLRGPERNRVQVRDSL